MNVLIACDKFKGSLHAAAVCESIADGVSQRYPNAIIKQLPLADGGDGTLQVLQHQLSFQLKQFQTTGPLQRPINARYLTDEETAYIELAEASGIQHLIDSELDIFRCSTQGTGKLIKHCLDVGHNKIVLSIGGSCTNDIGIGILAELGFTFINSEGIALDPLAVNLDQIAQILKPDIDHKFELTILCDVDNPLFGPHGAAAIYGPQKSASVEQVKFLDDGAKHFAGLVLNQFGTDISILKGGGAAGGIAAGLFGVLTDVVLKNGFDFIAELLHLKEEIKNTDIVITGEGKLDDQSLQGKVVGRIIDNCQAAKTPVIIIAGMTDFSKKELDQLNINQYHFLLDFADSNEDSLINASTYLRRIASHLTFSL